MKKPVKIDADILEMYISECEKWMQENKGKNPPQERDTLVAISCWKKIIAISQPI